ncbi:aspartate ammonia-lyase, partial [Campylobacter coli]|nr:aspartate ammonia-lyase [Campylobacter coli]
DVTVTFASEGGQLQLNVFEPVIAYSLFNSIVMLEKAMHTLADKCIDGISANEKICSDFVYNSVGIVTALNPYIGYENSASIAKEAMSTGKRVADIALERGLLSKEQIDEILTPANMLNPHMEAKK